MAQSLGLKWKQIKTIHKGTSPSPTLHTPPPKQKHYFLVKQSFHIAGLYMKILTTNQLYFQIPILTEMIIPHYLKKNSHWLPSPAVESFPLKQSYMSPNTLQWDSNSLSKEAIHRPKMCLKA